MTPPLLLLLVACSEFRLFQRDSDAVTDTPDVDTAAPDTDADTDDVDSDPPPEAWVAPEHPCREDTILLEDASRMIRAEEVTEETSDAVRYFGVTVTPGEQRGVPVLWVQADHVWLENYHGRGWEGVYLISAADWQPVLAESTVPRWIPTTDGGLSYGVIDAGLEVGGMSNGEAQWAWTAPRDSDDTATLHLFDAVPESPVRLLDSPAEVTCDDCIVGQLRGRTTLVLASDLDGDGLDDLLWTRHRPWGFRVWTAPFGAAETPETAGLNAETSLYLYPRVVADLDQDGYADVVAERESRLDVLAGPFGDDRDWDALPETSLLLDSATQALSNGPVQPVASVGDVTGDGRPDLAVAMQDEAEAWDQQLVIVDDLGPGAHTIDEYDTVFVPPLDPLTGTYHHTYGFSADANGDGHGDLVAMRYGSTGMGGGVDHVYVIAGPLARGTQALENAGATLEVTRSPLTEPNLFLPGDLDGDGADELVYVNNHAADQPGELFLLWGCETW